MIAFEIKFLIKILSLIDKVGDFLIFAFAVSATLCLVPGVFAPNIHKIWLAAAWAAAILLVPMYQRSEKLGGYLNIACLAGLLYFIPAIGVPATVVMFWSQQINQQNKYKTFRSGASYSRQEYKKWRTAFQRAVAADSNVHRSPDACAPEMHVTNPPSNNISLLKCCVRTTTSLSVVAAALVAVICLVRILPVETLIHRVNAGGLILGAVTVLILLSKGADYFAKWLNPEWKEDG